MSTAETEIEEGQRFAFGANWAQFLQHLDEDRIEIAEASLCELLGVKDLQGRRFLDAGSGSGLFSLCARRLGAEVVSFDFDPQSVACTQTLRSRYFPDDPGWHIETGSVLDQEFLKSQGTFDVVYSWGVLHHTGAMWQALENVTGLCGSGGKLAIAIYNDQGWLSKMWWWVKRIYCSGNLGKSLMLAVFIPYFFMRTIAVSCIRRHNEFAKYRRNRGMSIYYDWLDWLGGYPFEVASVDAVTQFYEQHGFQRVTLKETKRLGCNEFVFVKRALKPSE